MRKAWTLLLLIGACAPNTEVINSWKDPNAEPRKFNKVLAVFMTKDVGMRRAGEDELVRKLGNAVASYTVLPEEANGVLGKAIVDGWQSAGNRFVNT